MNAQINHIWKEQHDQLLSFIRKRVTDPAQAEDILQDVFLKILLKIDGLNNRDKLQSWLYQITRNTISDYFRQKEKENRLTGQQVETDMQDEQSAMKEAESWIGLYVADLPENYRQAVTMYEMEGLSVGEIADRLNISYTNARARVQRGRLALKKSLTDCCTFHVDVYGNVLEYRRNSAKCEGCE
ncbi:RNA polymerase sigma factor SigZ [Gaoshiqia sp. Z1-71]|uniref:RNA polymerase sigma factor SigZ n=1 Tax=Gaoshiqia hydrogeniformans TaxID=3290090 RepID=UPI003BF886F3